MKVMTINEWLKEVEILLAENESVEPEIEKMESEENENE